MNPKTQTVATLNGVSKTYGESYGNPIQALKPTNLTLERGKIYCLVGPSGSGKTTLLNLLGLLETPSSGSIHFSEQEVSKADESIRTDFRASKISFIFQENYLVPFYSALDNVLLPIIHTRKLLDEDYELAKELLRGVGLGREINKRISQLSGGQRQRVCIARALLKSPDLIIADEPSSALDSVTTKSILKIFDRLSSQNHAAIIVSTHDQTVIEAFNENIITLRDGEIYPC
ncbi:MAG: ABC transporter ATP-binding protein [Deltaproteobacteria bacterium]|jgi:ABC-type lipoprotein export system ATPase subunit|nr:ABC transporter ATP-binding protein [Deltaproteobacteria bacterium]MBT6491559.1 ABC transporter ATP-binding protein [Deltaproteobacteria bacterium]